MRTDVTILYIAPSGLGWFPVQSLARGCARLLEGHLVEIPDPGSVTRVQKILGELPRRRSKSGHLILIAPNPNHLSYAASFEGLFRGYKTVDAWVIDSFWNDRIPRMAKRFNHFDRIWITDGDLVDTWRATTRTDVRWLPWGTWALEQNVNPGTRTVDIQRYGRQPSAWDDDDAVHALAERMGLSHQGRPPFSTDGQQNQINAFHALNNAKFTLAFSNLVDPHSYTSKAREYVTARWTDSLNLGCVVAGKVPDTPTRKNYFWDSGLLELASLDVEEGLLQIRDAARDWSPETARTNHRLAIQKLDWGWRIAELAEGIGITRDPLSGYMDRLKSI